MNFPQYRCTLFELLWIRNSMDPNVDDFRFVFEEISHSCNNKQWRTDRGLPLTPLATPSNSSRCTAYRCSAFFLSSLSSFCSTLENNSGWKEETNPRRSVSGKERAELIARVNGGNHAKHDTPLSV